MLQIDVAIVYIDQDVVSNVAQHLQLHQALPLLGSTQEPTVYLLINLATQYCVWPWRSRGSTGLPRPAKSAGLADEVIYGAGWFLSKLCIVRDRFLVVTRLRLLHQAQDTQDCPIAGAVFCIESA